MKHLRRISRLVYRKKAPLLIPIPALEPIPTTSLDQDPIFTLAPAPIPELVATAPLPPILAPEEPQYPPPCSHTPISASGSLGLPVELWEEIFKYAIALLVLPFDVEHELQYEVSPLSVLSWGPPSIIHDFYQLQHPDVFSMRRSIVLVCRLWHQIGITALHSHLFIDFDDPVAKIQSLRQALEANPTFAQSVLRLSLTKRKQNELHLVTPYDGGRPDPDQQTRTIYRDELPKSRQRRLAFNAILSHLTQLKIVSCPTMLAHWVDMPKLPEICIANWPPAPALTSWYAYDIISTRPYFWSQVTTLSFSMRSDPWHAQYYIPVSEDQKTPFITFPNLTSLKLNVDRGSAIRWIAEYWIIPKLRSLSATSDAGVFWLRFVQRYASSLEYLELLGGYGYGYRPFNHPVITMPMLKSLCLGPTRQFHYNDSVQEIIDGIRAPNILHFALYVPPEHFFAHQEVHIVEKMNAGLRAHPKVKNIALYHGSECTSLVGWNWVEAAVVGWKERGLAVETRAVCTEKDIYWREGLSWDDQDSDRSF